MLLKIAPDELYTVLCYNKESLSDSDVMYLGGAAINIPIYSRKILRAVPQSNTKKYWLLDPEVHTLPLAMCRCLSYEYFSRQLYNTNLYHIIPCIFKTYRKYRATGWLFKYIFFY